MTEKSGSVELYNLEKDPYERKNIVSIFFLYFTASLTKYIYLTSFIQALRLPRFVSRLKLRLLRLVLDPSVCLFQRTDMFNCREYSEMRAARYSKQCKQGWPSQFGGVLTTGWCQPVVQNYREIQYFYLIFHPRNEIENTGNRYSCIIKTRHIGFNITSVITNTWMDKWAQIYDFNRIY